MKNKLVENQFASAGGSYEEDVKTILSFYSQPALLHN
jgi:hypothetical protein